VRAIFDLSGKTVVVTGGGRGIGRGIARAMAKCGADVVICGRAPGPLEETVAELTGLGVRARSEIIDITSSDDLHRLVDVGLEFGGGSIDCWVNNAGSANASDVGPLFDMTEANWDAVVDTNLKWTFFACQYVAKAMTGGGSIINISSRSGSQPNPMTGQYGAAKAGLENLTATMAAEWGHLGIRVNAVAPGVVTTERSGGTDGTMASESRRRRQIETVPLRRLGNVDDIGPLCVYLASDEASWTTGETIQVTGGSRITIGYLSYMHRIGKQLDAQAGNGEA
jgi:NAD(P)-dependent dehydrogenase (short-subunit alcohol dehydrogenase family)